MSRQTPCYYRLGGRTAVRIPDVAASPLAESNTRDHTAWRGMIRCTLSGENGFVGRNGGLRQSRRGVLRGDFATGVSSYATAIIGLSLLDRAASAITR